MKSWLKILLLFATWTILSCEKSEIGPQGTDPNAVLIPANAAKLLIGCEGTFGLGNASLSLLDIDANTASNNAFESVNGFGIGDILQSMFLHNGLAYLVVNNSSKILVIDTSSLAFNNEIVLNERSPRYMVASGNKAFVSNFAWNPPPGTPVYIDVLDLSTNIPIDAIDVGCWTEEMEIVGTKLYACGTGENKVFVIDVENHELTQEIIVGKEPVSMVEQGGDLWILCSGGVGSNHTEPASIWKINSENDMVITTLEFMDVDAVPSRLSLHNDDLYWLADDLFKMNVNELELPVNATLQFDDYAPYNYTIHDENSDIYVSDAVDFQSPGFVRQYTNDGSFIDEFQTGVIPSSFLFY